MPGLAPRVAGLQVACPLRVRSARGTLRASRLQLPPGHLFERRGELLFPLLTGVEVDPRSAGGRVTHPVHQLAERGARFCGQRVTGMPEVMDVQIIWQACFGQRLSPWLGKSCYGEAGRP